MAEIGMPVLRIVVGVYLGMCLLMFFRQSRYVYYPDRHVGLTPAAFDLAYEDLRIRTRDGEDLGAWFVPAPAQDKRVGTLLFCHGNAGDIGDRLESIRTFHRMGLDVLIFDYRGYGTSSGKPSEQGTYADGMAAWQYLTEERRIPASEVVLFGRSLGGAIATWLGTQVAPGALVIESSFTSATDMAKKLFPYLPVRLFCRFRYNTLSRIAKIRCPVLVAHGPDDEVVPFDHGQRLFQAARDPKLFVEMGGGHNDGGLDVNPAYQSALKRFLVLHLKHLEP